MDFLHVCDSLAPAAKVSALKDPNAWFEHLVDGSTLCAFIAGRAVAMSGTRLSSRLRGTARLSLVCRWLQRLGIGLMRINLQGPLAQLGLGNWLMPPLSARTSVGGPTVLLGRLAAQRAEAVTRSLIEPFVGKLQVREQLHRVLFNCFGLSAGSASASSWARSCLLSCTGASATAKECVKI